jgi:hypothetical protein
MMKRWERSIGQGTSALLLALVFLLVTAAPLRASTAVDDAKPVFLSILFQKSFEDHSADGIKEGQNWHFVDQDDRVYYCITNYNSQYGLYPIIHFGSADWVNYSVEVRLKVVGGVRAHTALLTRLDERLFGYRHALNYDELGGHFSQYHWQGGDKGAILNNIGERDIVIQPGKWYNLRAEVDGTTIRTLVNGYLISAHNVTYSEKGTAGVEAGPGAYLCVDYIIVRSLDRSAEAMAGVRRGTALVNANIRLGPGLNFHVISGVFIGEKVYILGLSFDHT